MSRGGGGNGKAGPAASEESPAQSPALVARPRPPQVASVETLFASDRSLRGWLILHDGGGGIIGRVVSQSPAASVEAGLRGEMQRGATPSCTLFPVYKLTSSKVFGMTTTGEMTSKIVNSMEPLSTHHNLGRCARLPYHVLLVAFGYLSELDDDSKRHLIRSIEDAERQTRALASGAVAG